MDISPIKSQRDYRNVLKEIEGLMIAKRNAPEGDLGAEALSNGSSGPGRGDQYHMDQNGLQPRDLINENGEGAGERAVVIS
jgi:HTH-type transcriptional regulator/antitoxin HigA